MVINEVSSNKCILVSSNTTLSSHLYLLGIHTSLNDKWDIPWYITQKRCITILYHAMENTVANNVIATYARRMMGSLGVILTSY